MLRGLKDRIRPRLLGVRRDFQTGHLYYMVEGRRLYIRFPEEAIRATHRRAAWEHVYFARYEPSGDDCVVDIGAGLGAEILPLAARAPGLRYVAVEIQPWVYECLCLTLAGCPAGFVPFGLAISDAPEVRISPTRAGEDAFVSGRGEVPVATVGWSAFLARHGIDRIDLLKMNIEGAEAELLETVDLAPVRRVIVGVHDFRADRGDGEHFRTRARVEARLSSCGFAVSPLPATDNWLYAERPGSGGRHST